MPMTLLQTLSSIARSLPRPVLELAVALVRAIANSDNPAAAAQRALKAAGAKQLYRAGARSALNRKSKK
jgi:hypothetical protein